MQKHILSGFSERVWICLIVLFLQMWGLFTISAGGCDQSFLWRQALWCVVGWLALAVMTLIPFRFVMKNLVLPFTLVSLFLMITVLFAGVRINGMRGWFEFGDIFFQPSEFGKVMYVLCLYAVWKKFSGAHICLLLFCLVFAAFSLPVCLQPDFGSVAIYFLMLVIFCWISSGSLRMMSGFVICLAAAVVTSALNKSYIMKRLLGFFRPEDDPGGIGWHILQFRYTMARGGLSGAGSAKSYWAQAYLPLSHSDSAFASLTEATGLVGALLVIIALICFTVCFYRLSLKKQTVSCGFFIFGSGMLLIVQSVIHIAVNVSAVPVTGITFPFFSYGGSSLVCSMVLVGLLLSASRCEAGAGESVPPPES